MSATNMVLELQKVFGQAASLPFNNSAGIYKAPSVPHGSLGRAHLPM